MKLSEKIAGKCVSVPSRGLGSFLHEATCVLDKLIVFPTPLEVWIGSYKPKVIKVGTKPKVFPSPIKVSVGSYLTIGINGVKADEFLSPREAWVGSYMISLCGKSRWVSVFGPSRGLGGVLLKLRNEGY